MFSASAKYYSGTGYLAQPSPYLAENQGTTLVPKGTTTSYTSGVGPNTTQGACFNYRGQACLPYVDVSMLVPTKQSSWSGTTLKKFAPPCVPPKWLSRPCNRARTDQHALSILPPQVLP